MQVIKSLFWESGNLYLLDQLLLPDEKRYIKCSTYKEVAQVIVNMNVRGAPAIGASAAYGIVLGACEYDSKSDCDFSAHMKIVEDCLRKTRPTAVNLFWAIDRMMNCIDYKAPIKNIIDILLKEAHNLADEDIIINKKLSSFGQDLLQHNDTILTHCNAGALATVGYGTALGVVRAAKEAGKNISVFADETRPYLQGARLTAWELLESGINVTLITDSMAGHFLKSGKINAVIVGADRVALNGDVANKIGTYGVAVLAKENNVPFYVASPISTLDRSIETGDEIVIEERNPLEVTLINGKSIAPMGVSVANPAFDVTPNKYITAIITEAGIVRPPFKINLTKLLGANQVNV